MTLLVAKRYPTRLFLKLADHTYVECGTGKRGWSCWGGKSGGSVLRSGHGSTKRADAIAQPDEKANITCYLVNGVCHQAANRILLTAAITVRGARGYSISHALYGVFGHPGYWPCRAPFRRYQGVKGDLSACVPKTSARARAASALTDAHRLDALFIADQLAIYQKARSLMSRGGSRGEVLRFQMALFESMARHQLGNLFDLRLRKRLIAVRRRTETSRYKLETAFAQDGVSAREFVDGMDRITLAFQDAMADTRSAQAYSSLFELDRDERVVLADPRIVKKVYGCDTTEHESSGR